MRNRIANYLDYLIYWTIILIPFFMAISPAPVNIFMGLAIAAYLAKKILRKEPLLPKTAIRLPLAVFFIITCVSIIHSINYSDTIKGGILRLLQFSFVLFIILDQLKDKKHISMIIISVALGITLASLDGIFQVFTGHDFIRGYEPVRNLGLTRATASFKDANLLGIYLSALVPLVAGLVLFYYKGKERLFFMLAAILGIAGILLTYSRPTLLAIYLVFVFFGIARKSKALISLVIILALISPFILPKSIKNWAREVEYNPLRFMCNDDRIAVYRNSLQMIKDHPIIGVGANTYMKNYKKYKESPEYRGVITQDTMYAHNIYLHMAGEIGLVGLGIFIWFLFRLFLEAARVHKLLKDRYLKVISLSLIACLIAFLVNGLTESSLYYSRVAILFWYLAGFLLSLKKFTIP